MQSRSLFVFNPLVYSLFQIESDSILQPIPPTSEFMVTQAGNYMLSQNGNRMITET